jgi:hypothetical protein
MKTGITEGGMRKHLIDCLIRINGENRVALDEIRHLKERVRVLEARLAEYEGSGSGLGRGRGHGSG